MAGNGKEFPLSITIRTVDRATAGIKRINERLERSFKPFRDMSKEFGNLRQNMGLPKIADGLRGIAGMAKQLAVGLGVVGAAGAGAALAIKGIVDEYDALATRADRVGLSVDAMAQLEHAAAKSDVEVGELSSAMQAFNRSLGQAKAGTGRMAGFLKKVSPALLQQVKGAKNTEEAFGLMADAMVKVKDPAKRAALATAAFGGSGTALIPMLTRGKSGIEELRAEFFRAAGSQEDAAAAAGAVDDALKDVGASMKGVKATILTGLAPALTDLAKRASGFFSEHREQIGAWVRDFGEKLPARIEALIGFLRRLRDEAIMPVVRAVGWIVGKLGGAESAVKILVAAFVAFKGLQLAGHLASVAQGLLGVAAAAGGAAAGAGRLGLLGAVSAVAAPAAIAYGAAKVSSLAIDSDQDQRMAARDRGFSVLADLERARAGNPAAMKMLLQSLRTGGFIDAQTGRFADTFANRQALAGGELGSGGPADMGRMAQVERTIDGLNLLLAASRPTLGAAGMGGGKTAAASVTVKFENAPAGTRVTTDPGSTAAVDTSVGYQLGGAL